MSTMNVSLGQFFVQESCEENLAICKRLIESAESEGSDLLVLPEGIIARKPGVSSFSREHAETLDGPFVKGLQELTRGKHVAVTGTVHIRVPGETKVHNDLIVVRDGKLELVYTKLHLYDAFSGKESDNVVAGHSVPELVEIAGFKVGFMTCYDVRFPELARALALKGADLIVVSAAWVKGPLKEMHWDINVRARALENTCYVAAVSESGPVNIGESKIVNPLGLVTAQCGATDELLTAKIDSELIAKVRKTLPVLENRRFAAPVLA